MKEIKNMYLIVDKQKYFGYTGYVFDNEYNKKFDNAAIVSNNICDVIKKENMTVPIDFVIPRNSKIYLYPKYPYAIDDIRKYYTIKHNPNDADYIVINDNTISFDYSYIGWNVRYDVVICPSEKKIFLFDSKGKTNNTRERILQKAVKTANEIKDLDWDSLIVKNCMEFEYVRDNVENVKIIKALLDGTITEPYVFCDKLNINSDVEMNLELLKTLNVIVGQQRYKSEAEENCIVQLNVLNNHNWREYKGTLMLLFDSCPDGSIIMDMSCHPSRYNKPVQEILNLTRHYKRPKELFTSEKDFNLARDYMCDRLEIGDGRTCTFTGLARKLKKENISEDYFNMFFSNKVRIVPGSFSEYNSDNDKKGISSDEEED